MNEQLQAMIEELLPAPPDACELFAMSMDRADWYIVWDSPAGAWVELSVAPANQTPDKVADLFWKKVAEMTDEYESRARTLRNWMLNPDNVAQLLAARRAAKGGE
jgi:hypothetical protein